LATLAPGAAGSAPKTPGREGRSKIPEQGYLYCGAHGAGHFVRMVHNGIEYGMMAAYAEGLNILKHAGVGRTIQEADAETTPLRDQWAYQNDFDMPDVAEAWRRGSVIASWLLDFTAAALAADPTLDHFAGRVSDSGEGRWTLDTAIDEGCRRTFLPLRCSRGSHRAVTPSSRTVCIRRCGPSSEAMRRSLPRSLSRNPLPSDLGSGCSRER